MQKTSHGSVLVLLMLGAMLASACTQTYSQAPLATPTLIATGLFVSPFPSGQDPLQVVADLGALEQGGDPRSEEHGGDQQRQLFLGHLHGPAHDEGDQHRGPEHGQVVLEPQQDGQADPRFAADGVEDPPLGLLTITHTRTLLRRFEKPREPAP